MKKIEDEEYNGEDYGIDSLYHAQRILEKTLGKVDGYQTDDGILSHKCAITAVKKLYEQKPEENKGNIGGISSNRWRPSETDIMILEKVFSGKIDPKDFQATLSNVLEQLKKLKEE